MATILFAWELGGGLGHTLPLVPLVERLCGRGHRLVLLVREVDKAAKLFAGLDATCLQAPYLTGRVDGRADGLRTFPHILHNAGFGDPAALRSLAEAWRSRLVAAQCPAILHFDGPVIDLRQRFQQASLRFVDAPVDMVEAARQCDMPTQLNISPGVCILEGTAAAKAPCVGWPLAIGKCSRGGGTGWFFCCMRRGQPHFRGEQGVLHEEHLLRCEHWDSPP